MIETQNPGALDVVLIGAGIMSATLGIVLKELEPSLSIMIFETLEDCGQESSQAWNNAGTGHAANCELNYTPQRTDGSVDISEALKVNTEFDLSRQLWSYLIRKSAIPNPRAFIHPCPHMSFVWGKDNVAFLRKRFGDGGAAAAECLEFLAFLCSYPQIDPHFSACVTSARGACVAAEPTVKTARETHLEAASPAPFASCMPERRPIDTGI
jgi:malate dehydrogenase (quinone)